MTRCPDPVRRDAVCQCWRRRPVMAAAARPRILPEITTPDRVQTQIGTLDLADGAPSIMKPVQEVYDTMDFIRAVARSSIVSGGASAYAIRQGFLSTRRNGQLGRHFRQSRCDLKYAYLLTANADTVTSGPRRGCKAGEERNNDPKGHSHEQDKSRPRRRKPCHRSLPSLTTAVHARRPHRRFRPRSRPRTRFRTGIGASLEFKDGAPSAEHRPEGVRQPGLRARC